MGQAKQKGTFAERQQAAYDRIEQLDILRANNLKRLEEAEAVSDERASAMLAFHAEKSLNAALNRSPLGTADWTLIPQFGEAVRSDIIKAEVKKAIEAELEAMQ